MMKKKVCAALVKQIIGAVSSMGKGKTLEALKRKTRAIKARIIIFSLLSNNKLVMITSISHKLHALFGHSDDSDHHDDHQQLEEEEDDDDDGINQDHQYQNSNSIINNDHSIILMSFHESQSHLQQPRPVHDNTIISTPTDHHDHDYITTSEDHVVINDAEKYPDLTHSLFDSDDDQFGSVIDIVKNSKQEAGQEFSLEEEIDHVADLFIRRFHRQIRIQRQHSFKRHQQQQ
ncbi:hypothetical protein ACFX13_023544 [Malus domestica]|uniref:Uncharacterized protein n=1 Tax=Malus domestica TaxID=3750 RepID=A0A498HE24_MALDO|nr:uncharacterized protein LOC126609932 [Malus sylvestris]RXH69708.1 hypothetical protein DVH24_037492 [Malus domestica]